MAAVRRLFPSAVCGPACAPGQRTRPYRHAAHPKNGMIGANMNFSQARRNMIDGQVRTWDVFDPRVLESFERLPREDFVTSAYRRLALADSPIPLPHGQETLTPKVEARLLQALAVEPTDRILEIGTGCAYCTALLAYQAKTVCSVDVFPEFPRAAKPKLARHGLENVTLETGDALHGWPARAPYHAIAVTGSLPRRSPAIERQLCVGGRLFAVLGRDPIMTATRVTRIDKDTWRAERLFETTLPPLIGAEQAEEFQF